MPSLRLSVLTLALALSGFAARDAAAQTVINSLPYTINASGKYIVGTNLIYSANGLTNLITVNTSNVILDLNEFFVSGPGTLTASVNAAVYVNNVSNVTIRNGTVANTGYGIYFASGANSINHVVENVNVTRCYLGDIYFQGSTKSTRVSRCTVSDTGNSTLNNQDANAIYTFSGVKVEDCILHTGVPSGTGSSYGINGAAGSFYVRNVITNFGTGIVGGKYSDNLTSSCTVPFSGGTNVGGNN